MFKRAPLLVTDFSDVSLITHTNSGGGSSSATSSAAGDGKGIYIGSDSVKLSLTASASGDESQARFNCFVPADRSDRFCLRYYQDIPVSSENWDENWSIELTVGNTTDDLTNSSMARFLRNTPSKNTAEHIIVARSNFDQDNGTGVDWAQPIRCARVVLRKATDGGQADIWLDALFAGWELFRVPIGFSCDDNSNDNTDDTGGDNIYQQSYGQYTYLWKQVFEPRDWRITLCTTQNLVGGANSMSVVELAEMHRAGCDVVFAGEDHLDHRTTAEGGAYADEAALRASIAAYQSWAKTNGFNRARESQWAALPFGAYGPTIDGLFEEYGIRYNRKAGGGHSTDNQYQYAPLRYDGFMLESSKEHISNAIGYDLLETAAAIMALVADAVEKQAGLSLFLHKIADSVGTNTNYFAKAQADLLWPALDAQEASGAIKVCQLTEMNLIQGGDLTSRHNRARKAGTGRR